MLFHVSLTLLLVHLSLLEAVFWNGADMSALSTIDCSGTCSQYQLSPGQKMDALSILKKCNMNIVRMRIWNDPSGSDTYCNLDGVLKMAKRIKNAGLELHLDFHYSDTWADPGHQIKPHLWASFTGDTLVKAVYNYTKNVVSSLKQQGTPPAVVQVGNEITVGMLWAPQGEPCSSGGYITGSCDSNWPYFAQLVKSGIQGVHDAGDPSPLVMVHTDQGNGISKWGDAQPIVDWFKKLQSYGLTWDIIGLSFYPVWGSGNISNVQKLGIVHQAFPNMGIVLAETNYPFEGNPDWKGEFPFTEQGQQEYLTSLLKAVHNLPGGSGVYWWGTEYYVNYGNNPPLFDHSGVALPALKNSWSNK